LLRSRSNARNGLSVPTFRKAGIADSEDLWEPWNREILKHLDAPRTVGGNVEPSRSRGCGNTRRPQDAARGYPIPDHDTIGIAARDGLARPDLYSEPLQGLVGGSGQSLGKAGQNSGPRLDQNDPRVRGLDTAKIMNQRGLGELGNGTGEFHTCRATANYHEIEKSTALARLVANLRCLEG
jgi:hypothetical protein